MSWTPNGSVFNSSTVSRLRGLRKDYNCERLTGFRAFAAYAYGIMPARRWEEEFNATRPL